MREGPFKGPHLSSSEESLCGSQRGTVPSHSFEITDLANRGPTSARHLSSSALTAHGQNLVVPSSRLPPLNSLGALGPNAPEKYSNITSSLRDTQNEGRTLALAD